MSNVDKDEMPLGPGPGSDSDEDFLGEEPAPAPAPPKADMKSKLLELANRKRREQEEEERAKAKSKRRKRAGSEDELQDEQAEEDAEDPSQPAAEPSEAAAAAAADDRDDEGDLVISEADRDFIDDTGVAEEDRIDFGDDEEAIDAAEEAREDAGMGDELDRLFSKGRRGRDRDGEPGENRALVENLLALMEVAVEEDMKDYEAGKPAVHKLRMLQRVEDALATKRLHIDLLDAGLLGTLKAWLEPMPDGTLPNARVRGAVLRALTGLPVDVAYEDRREQLKRSGLGTVVMFYYKLPDETPANRRLAKELVQRWSRPLLARRGGSLDPEEAERILAARRARAERARAGETAAREAAAQQEAAALKPGDRGFRWHAPIPQPASLDYVKAPEPKYAMPEKKGGSGKAAEHKLVKKLKGKTGAGSAARAATLSVEGRNVTFRN